MNINQIDLEMKYSKKFIPNRIWKEVCDDTSLLEVFDNNEEAKAILVALLIKNREQPIQSFISIVVSQGYDFETSVELMIKYSEKELYEIIQYESGKLAVKPLICLDDEIIKQFSLTTVLPPLIREPKDWINNKTGGYYSIQHNCILGSLNYHDKYQAIDVLNKLQKIKWKINVDVLTNFHDPVVYSREKETDIHTALLDETFYFMWQFDKRGRMYSKGYELNLQSTEYHKALLDFAEGSLLDEEGINNLMIAIANSAGYDKLSWESRIEKTSELLDSHVYLDGDEVTINTSGIAEPILFTKYVKALVDSRCNIPCHTPVALDCTASGLQIMSVLTGCINTAEHTNIIDKGGRVDVYTAVVEHMNAILLPEEHVDRDLVKQPLMTYFYNSTACPEATFNDNQLEAFYDAIEGEFTGPNMLMDYINDHIWTDRDTFSWTFPDGHKVIIRIQDKESVEVTLEEDITFVYEYPVHKANGNHRHLVPNFIHSVDAYVARELVRRCDFEVATIHDSFWCLPQYMGIMAKTFKEIMIELAESNFLNEALSEIAGRPIKFKKLSDNLPELMQTAKYMLS